MILCQELTLPPVPDFLIDQSLDIIAGNTSIKNMQSGVGRIDISSSGTSIASSYDRYIELNSGEVVRGANVERFPFTEEFYSWFEENIYSGIRKCNPIQLSSQVIKNGSVLQTHTDGPRGPYVLSYLIDAGGEEVDTIWYQQDGHPVFRNPGFSILYDKGLTEIFKIRVKPFSWAIMNTKALHGVRFMTRPRTMISVGLYPKELNLFLEENNLKDYFNLEI